MCMHNNLYVISNTDMSTLADMCAQCPRTSVDISDNARMPALQLPYRQKYWQTLYLVVFSKHADDGILNWQISVLYGEKSMLVV